VEKVLSCPKKSPRIKRKSCTVRVVGEWGDSKKKGSSTVYVEKNSAEVEQKERLEGALISWKRIYNIVSFSGVFWQESMESACDTRLLYLLRAISVT